MKKFNIAAAIWGRLWMSYHFLAIPLLFVSIMDIAVYTLIEAGVRYSYSDMIQAKLTARIIGFVYICFKFVLFGILGNRFLKTKQEKKHNKYIRYLEDHEKSIVFRVTAVMLYLIWLAIGEQMLIWEILIHIFY